MIQLSEQGARTVLLQDLHPRSVVFRGTPVDPLLRTLSDIFEKNADKVAVVDTYGSYTYRDLLSRSRLFTNSLRAAGVEAGSSVALSMRKEYSYVYAVVGCLIAGNTFLPVDPGYPAERKQYMIDDAGAAAAVINFDMCERIVDAPIILDVRHLDQMDPQIPEFEGILRAAYAIYTSGTTGRPKGVAIASSALDAFVKAQGQALDVTNSSRFASVASISFDMSIWEIFMALGHGGTIVMIDRDIVLDGRKLGAALNRYEITHVLMTPSVLSILPEDAYPSLRHVISAGEKCSSKLVDFWSKQTRFYDAYGATEATIYTTIIRKTPDTPPSCVGAPMVGTDIRIVDETGAILGTGDVGEICVVGPLVSPGYHNRPELNALKFIMIGGKPAYRTGDTGFVDAAGRLFYNGRIDRQVKFNGYRIELEEIERVANESGHVALSAATLHTGGSGRVSLFLFVVPLDPATYAVDVFRDAIRKILPNYMMPGRIFDIASMPVTDSGKADIRRLINSITERAL